MPDFFDCDVMLGQTVAPPAAPLLDARALLEEMDRHNIAKALVFHYAAAFGPEAAARMNERTLASVRASSRLVPCAALATTISQLDQKLEAQVDAIAAAGFRAARIVPGEGPTAHPVSLSLYALDATLAGLERRRMPLLIPAEHFDLRTDPILTYSFDHIDAVCRAFPQLPVILLRPHYTAQAGLIPLMRRHANLHISATLLTLLGQVESFAAMFGAERILFGSHTPYRDPSVPYGNIAYGRLSPRDKELIAGGNLRRLLEAVR